MAQRTQASRRSVVDDAREAVAACTGTGIRLAARRISRFLDRHLEGTGLSIAQLGLMAHVATAPDDTIGALAGRTGLDPSTLSRNLRSLERAGLVEIAIVEQDLRRRAVWLTETGAHRLQAALPAWRAAQAALAAVVDPRDVARLAAATAALVDVDAQAAEN